MEAREWEGDRARVTETSTRIPDALDREGTHPGHAH